MRPVLPTYSQVTDLQLTHETVVSSEWIDVMGHMNVAYYTASFSAAMGSLRTSFGMDDPYVKANQIGSFAIETHTRYVSESHIGDPLHIHSRIIARSSSRKRLHAMHFMVNPTRQEVAATFEAIVGIVDLVARRMIPLPDEILHQLDQIVVQHQRLSWSAPVCGVLSCT